MMNILEKNASHALSVSQYYFFAQSLPMTLFKFQLELIIMHMAFIYTN